MGARVKLLGGMSYNDLLGECKGQSRKSDLVQWDEPRISTPTRRELALFSEEREMIGRSSAYRRHRDEDELSGMHDIIGDAGRRDIIGDDDDDDDDISVGDIIGAMKRVIMGKDLSHKDRKALRVQHRLAKKQLREGADLGSTSDSQLALALRKADRPIVKSDEDGTLRTLNFPLGTITVPAGTTADFAVVAQESIRCERLFLYPAGGNYDQLFVVNMFAGRQPNSVVPGLEEPMIDYSPTAVNSSIEGFTVNFGLTLRITLLNRTGDDVDVSGKIKGRTIT